MSQTTLGKYQIIREIARSNDIVYEAYDPVMNRRVAVKELAMPGGATQQQRDDRVKRFLREARAAGSLVHPNIVTIYEVGEDAGRRFIAMEYLDGQNLRNLLDTKGFIEPKRAVEIAIKVLDGLEFAHSKGVIHRDVKPDNIQLLESGEVKITDFGIARLTFEPNLTMDGQVFGTPSYMSPEQINGREIDARSDLFGMGVILYEMVAGQKPFQGDSVVSITYSIMNSEPSQPTQCGPTLWQVIRQALDKSPQLRWSSAREMSSALKSVLAQMVGGSVVADPLPVAQAMPVPAYPTMGPVTPGPPPVIHPPMVAPANPYGPGFTPYGTPMPPQTAYQQVVPPAAQQFSAYGQPYQFGQAPQAGQPYTGQGLPPVPVYYPPAPRGPLVSPETKAFLGKLFMAFLFVGTIVAIVVMAIVQGSKAASGGDPVHASVGSGPPKVSDASGAVPPVAAPTSDDARQFISQAMTENSPGARQKLWAKAAAAWTEVFQHGDQQQVAFDAVGSYVQACDALIQRSEFDKAREALYQAEPFAQGNPRLEAALEDRWRALVGR